MRGCRGLTSTATIFITTASKKGNFLKNFGDWGRKKIDRPRAVFFVEKNKLK